MHILKLSKHNLNSLTQFFPFYDHRSSSIISQILEVVKSNPAAKNYLLCSTND